MLEKRRREGASIQDCLPCDQLSKLKDLRRRIENSWPDLERSWSEQIASPSSSPGTVGVVIDMLCLTQDPIAQSVLQEWLLKRAQENFILQ